MPHSPPPDPNKAWLDLDDRVDERLEDYIKIANTPIARANIIVTVGFIFGIFHIDLTDILALRLYKEATARCTCGSMLQTRTQKRHPIRGIITI